MPGSRIHYLFFAFLLTLLAPMRADAARGARESDGCEALPVPVGAFCLLPQYGDESAPRPLPLGAFCLLPRHEEEHAPDVQWKSLAPLGVAGVLQALGSPLLPVESILPNCAENLFTPRRGISGMRGGVRFPLPPPSSCA